MAVDLEHDLDARLRAYAATLDRHADRLHRDQHAAAAWDGDDGGKVPPYVISLERPAPARRVYVAAVAAALALLLGSGAILLWGVGDAPREVGTADQPGGAPGGTEAPAVDETSRTSHSDMEACMAEAETELLSEYAGDRPGPREPLPELRELWDECLMALDAEVLASGEVHGTTWELIVSDDPTGRWVRVRADGLDGSFGQQLRAEEGPGGALFQQVGVCCRLEDEDLFLAVTGADVESVAIHQDGALLAETATVADPEHDHTRFALVPLLAASGRVDVTFHLADGTTIEPVTGGIDLAHRGG